MNEDVSLVNESAHQRVTLFSRVLNVVSWILSGMGAYCFAFIVFLLVFTVKAPDSVGDNTVQAQVMGVLFYAFFVCMPVVFFGGIVLGGVGLARHETRTAVKAFAATGLCVITVAVYALFFVVSAAFGFGSIH